MFVTQDYKTINLTSSESRDLIRAVARRVVELENSEFYDDMGGWLKACAEIDALKSVLVKVAQ